MGDEKETALSTLIGANVFWGTRAVLRWLIGGRQRLTQIQTQEK